MKVAALLLRLPLILRVCMRLQALLVTADRAKVGAMRTALPTSRYELIVATTEDECMAFLNGAGAKYMPDVVLLDSQFGRSTQVRACV